MGYLALLKEKLKVSSLQAIEQSTHPEAPSGSFDSTPTSLIPGNELGHPPFVDPSPGAADNATPDNHPLCKLPILSKVSSDTFDSSIAQHESGDAISENLENALVRELSEPPNGGSHQHTNTQKTIDTLTPQEKALVLSWLTSIGERDGSVINQVLEQCNLDSQARRFYLGRANCSLE